MVPSRTGRDKETNVIFYPYSVPDGTFFILHSFKMSQNDFTKVKEYTISIKRANLVALFLIIPIALFYIVPFYIVWGKNIFVCIKSIRLLWALLSIPLGIIVHELSHGVIWAMFSNKGFRSIRFGIMWEYLTPYCHCSEPLKVWQYIFGGLAPLFIMGFLPGICALITGNAFLMFIAMFFTWAAGGDIQAVWMLRKFKMNQHVIDHPVELGFIVVDA